MSDHPTSLRQLITAALLPIIGLLPFQFFLHRDFVHFQRIAPEAAASQKVPFSPERAIAGLAFIVCCIVGLLLLDHRLRTIPDLSPHRAWIIWAYLIGFGAVIYFSAPAGYWTR